MQCEHRSDTLTGRSASGPYTKQAEQIRFCGRECSPPMPRHGRGRSFAPVVLCADRILRFRPLQSIRVMITAVAVRALTEDSHVGAALG
jgi:hypothetical protein